MFYPRFEVAAVGGGILIAIVAIAHIVVAHFAVGAGLFVAVTETVARRRGDALLLRFLRDKSRFLILVAFVFGAVSGVGIWFTISVVDPLDTSTLIHAFVWAWGVEWVLFAVEIVAGYCYYYTWDTLSGRRHTLIGWIYAAASYGSLFVINGIITFMLTPGRTFELRDAGQYDAALFAGLFNPTFWPSLALRTLSCLALAGIFVCIVVNLSPSYTREQRTRVINHGAYCLVPFALMAPVSIWYFNNVPEAARRMAGGGAIAMTLFMAFGVVCSVMIGLYAYFGLIRSRRYISLETSLLLAGMALIATGAMEFVREGIRKPYVIHGYRWSNGIRARTETLDEISRAGILTRVPWIVDGDRAATADPRSRGRWVFQAQCSQCHTVDGVNGIRPLVAYDREIIRNDIEYLHIRKSFMPPFAGSDREKDDLAAYLFSLNHVTHRRPVTSDAEGEP